MLLNLYAEGIYLGGRAFDCSPRSPWFEPGFFGHSGKNEKHKKHSGERYLTQQNKLCSRVRTGFTRLQWCYWICMEKGYSSVVEHSAAVREVPGSNPGVPLYNFWKTRKKMTLIARVHLTRNKKHCNSARTTWVCLQWCYWICMQRGYSSVVEHSAAVREVTGLNPGVLLYNFWKTREKWHRSREYTWLGTKNIVTVFKQPALHVFPVILLNLYAAGI